MYADLISQKIRNVYQKGVATKILQGMDRIRNEFDELQARRWPTELLQNARDLANPDQPVRVQIELTDGAVCFRHSGRPFSVKDILSIINQVSSKHPGEGVGQFGTGFMSTFQLSMQVDVRSFLKDEGEPYKPFCIRLDRSGNTYEAISGAIDEAIESLKAADRAPAEREYDRAAFNTEFCYHLMDSRSRRIAQMGVGDLRMTLAHILLFSPEIGEAELLIHTEQGREELRFRRGAERGVPGGLRWQEIVIGTQSRTFITLQRGEITLAAEWSEASGFQPVGPGTPRLYVGFPLVGSEQFPLESWEAVLRARDAQTDAIQWLDRFYGKTAQYLSVADLFWTPIIPNQYGIFRAPNDLKLDRIGDEEIKEISVCFKQERAACDVLNDLVDRRLPMPGWNLSSMSLNEAAGGVNTALQRFLARTTLSEAPLALQEACTRLLGWIQDHPKEAGQHFPMFCEEEDQMKLLTPKAAVSLRKKADRLNNLLTIAQTDDLETLVQLVQRGTELAGGSVEDGDDGWYDPDSGLYLDEGWNELDSRAREDRLRRIGEAGEFGVFRLAVAHFRDQNLSLEQDDGHVARLISPDGTKQVTITWPETERYHQPGWDISVQIQQAGETQEYFLEVKTHTPGSRVRSLIPLSDTQMRQAVRLGERYILVLAIYDEAAERVVGLDWFHSVLSSLADGTLHSAKGGFTLRHRQELPQKDETCLTIPA